MPLNIAPSPTAEPITRFGHRPRPGPLRPAPCRSSRDPSDRSVPPALLRQPRRGGPLQRGGTPPRTPPAPPVPGPCFPPPRQLSPPVRGRRAPDATGGVTPLRNPLRSLGDTRAPRAVGWKGPAGARSPRAGAGGAAQGHGGEGRAASQQLCRASPLRYRGGCPGPASGARCPAYTHHAAAAGPDCPGCSVRRSSVRSCGCGNPRRSEPHIGGRGLLAPRPFIWGGYLHAEREGLLGK